MLGLVDRLRAVVHANILDGIAYSQIKHDAIMCKSGCHVGHGPVHATSRHDPMINWH